MKADTFEKTGTSALYIENPIETELNVTKNVSDPDLGRFTDNCLSAINELNKHKETGGQQWGLLAILQEKALIQSTPIDMNIGDIFSDESSDDTQIINDDSLIDVVLESKNNNR